MKKVIIISVMILVFLSGALLFLYPSIANYFNQKNFSKVIDSYSKAVEQHDSAEIAEQLERAHSYNEELYEHMIVLTDPFDPDAFPITDEQYEAILDLDEVMAYIEIPAIDVKLPIYHGTSQKTLEKGVGHLENTSVPVGGESTHTVLSAHCGLPSAVLFTNLDKLSEGNIFKIYVLNETLIYQVYKTEIVLPKECSTLYINKGEDVATLMTCTPYGENTHRLLVHGKRISEEEAKLIEQNEPKIEKEMDWEDWLDIAMVFLSAVFLILMILVIVRSRRKEKADE